MSTRRLIDSIITDKGKFANGAVTAAFAAGFNDCAHRQSNCFTEEGRYRKAVGGRTFDTLISKGCAGPYECSIGPGITFNGADPQTAAFLAARQQQTIDNFLSYSSDVADAASVLPETAPVGIAAGAMIDGIQYLRGNPADGFGTAVGGAVTTAAESVMRVPKTVANTAGAAASIFYNHREDQ